MTMHKLISRLIVAAVLLAAPLAITPVITSASALSSARIKVGVASAVIPQARGGEAQEKLEIITLGDRVNRDMLIETGRRGRTQVLFVDGSSMNIGPSSRIVIDAFVFDPKTLSGGLEAQIEDGSMRFIGGILSKRADQVKFNVGDMTVGIRGGIVKISRDNTGKIMAELVHGRLSVSTPEGVFETKRIGTVIERDAGGAVRTRSVSAEEIKVALDKEAKDGEEAIEEPVVPDEAGEPTPGVAIERLAEEGATGDVLTEEPLESGLVEVDEEGNLKASEALVEQDPAAAELVNDGSLALDNEGNLAPTEKMIDSDATARELYENGLLRVDENGLLVPTEKYAEQEAATLQVDPDAPVELYQEEERKANVANARIILAQDRVAAQLYRAGQLEINAQGLLVPSEAFNPLIATRIEENDALGRRRSYIEDNAADRVLLDVGILDTRLTTRVVGRELAGSLYSEVLVERIIADIRREQAVIALNELAASLGLRLSEEHLKGLSVEEMNELGRELARRAQRTKKAGEQQDSGSQSTGDEVTIAGRQIAVEQAEPNAKSKASNEAVPTAEASAPGTQAEPQPATTETITPHEFVLIGKEETPILPPEKFLPPSTEVVQQAETDVHEQNSETRQTERQEVISETREQFATMSLAGLRVADTPSDWGEYGRAIWVPYLTLTSGNSAIVRDASGRLQYNFEARGNGLVAGDRVTVKVSRSGPLVELGSLLSSFDASASLNIIMQANNTAGLFYNVDRSQTQTIATNLVTALQAAAPPGITICDCDQMSTGLWQIASFTDSVSGESFSSSHQGHWAAGTKIDASTIRQLTGQRATFSGHAYGTVSYNGVSNPGFGSMRVDMDFANPSDPDTNTWNLSNFQSEQAPTVSTSVPITYQEGGARYGGTSGGTYTTFVEGTLFGTSTSNLQTGGSFTIQSNAAGGNYAAAGSFAAQGEINE